MTTAAGWHADPSGRHQLRYWDGTNWTDHVADNGTTGTDTLSEPAAPPSPAAPQPPATGGSWLDKLSAAAQNATDQGSKWIDENLSGTPGSQPSPGPTAVNSPAPTTASPPATAAASTAPSASASPPPSASSSPPPAASPSQAPSANGTPPAGAPPVDAPAAAERPPADLADQLRKLAQLRDEGILTDDEFATQKSKLLGS